MRDQYAVIGNPVGHSKSPDIHKLFAHQTKQSLDYTTLLAPLDSFDKVVADFFEHQQGKGLNVTVPFKQEAWELCNQSGNELSDYAKLAGAVNTLVYRDDKTLFGTNTDGIGIVTDLENNHQVKLADKNILILGAGGAVRGVLQPILEKLPKHVFIANRTASKAHDLAGVFNNLNSFLDSSSNSSSNSSWDSSSDSSSDPASDPSSLLKAGGYEAIPNIQYDVVINGTAASLKGVLPPVSTSCIAHAECCYDMMYANEPTAFVQWANEHNVPKALDGLGMLIEQAAESFSIWRGVRPDTKAVFSALRK